MVNLNDTDPPNVTEKPAVRIGGAYLSVGAAIAILLWAMGVVYAVVNVVQVTPAIEARNSAQNTLSSKDNSIKKLETELATERQALRTLRAEKKRPILVAPAADFEQVGLRILLKWTLDEEIDKGLSLDVRQANPVVLEIRPVENESNPTYFNVVHESKSQYYFHASTSGTFYWRVARGQVVDNKTRELVLLGQWSPYGRFTLYD